MVPSTQISSPWLRVPELRVPCRAAGGASSSTWRDPETRGRVGLDANGRLTVALDPIFTPDGSTSGWRRVAKAFSVGDPAPTRRVINFACDGAGRAQGS